LIEPLINHCDAIKWIELLINQHEACKRIEVPINQRDEIRQIEPLINEHDTIKPVGAVNQSLRRDKCIRAANNNQRDAIRGSDRGANRIGARHDWGPNHAVNRSAADTIKPIERC
jgi:hypothetical protein